MKDCICKTVEETEALGASFARTLSPGSVVALHGDMGAGKTAFVRGAANALGEERPSSPTFSILNEYDCVPPVYHFDLYRLSGVEDLEAVGFERALDAEGIVFIEWPERAADRLPADRIDVFFLVESDQARRICFGGNVVDESAQGELSE